MGKKYVIAYDIGTTGVKTCLFEIENEIKLIAAAMEGYNLYILPGGGAEQDPDEWWQAICNTTKTVFSKCDILPEQIEGISFCSQMQGLVLVDKDLRPVHRAFSYMDQRAKKQIKDGIAYGIKIAGANIFKLIPSLIITGAVSASVKDPVWKYNWVKENEPENFKRVHKWLDVKEYIICRMTDRCVMTRDSAFGTLLYDIRKGKEGFSKTICKLLGVDINHLPEIVESTDWVGGLTEKAAAELGLRPGTAVFGGGGDASLIGVGAGSVELGETHVYNGTSGWVSTVVDKSVVDASAMIAAIIGAQKDSFNYFAELETAGKCLEWVKDHLALDEIGIFLDKTDVVQSKETVYTSLYDYLSKVVNEIPAGSQGVIFTPWLHGNRCPFEDPNATGMFFGLNLETTKAEMVRAVLEGVCYHLRWMMESQDKKLKTSDPIRFVGGGARSPIIAQMLADITGRRIETVESPQNVGSVGAAAVMAVGMGIIPSLESVQDFIPVAHTYEPHTENRAAYDRCYAVFRKLYSSNRKNYRALAQQGK